MVTGDPPFAAVAAGAGGAGGAVQVGLLADELPRAAARHIIPLARRGHGHAVLHHRRVSCLH